MKTHSLENITNESQPAGALPRLAFSVEETCHITGFSKPTIYRLVAARKLRSCGGTRHLRFTMDEIKRYLRATTEAC